MRGYLVKKDMFYGHHTESSIEKNSNKTKIILFLILILLFCTACGLLVYFFVFYEKNEENININDKSTDENKQKEQNNYLVEEKKREELKKKLTLLVKEKTRKALDKEYESDSSEEENDLSEAGKSFDDSIVKNKIDMEEVRRQVLNQLEMTQKHINEMEQKSKASQEGKYYKRAGKVAQVCMNLLKTHPYFKTLNMAYSLGSLAFSFTGILKNEVDDKSPVSKKVVGELINFVKSKVPTNNNEENINTVNPKREFAEHLLNDFLNNESQNPATDITPVSTGSGTGSVTTMVASLLLGYMTNKIKGR